MKPETNAYISAIIWKWPKNDSKAKSDIILSISPPELKHIKGFTTSREVWLKLERIDLPKGPARKATILKQLMLSKIEKGGKVWDHIGKMFDINVKLEEVKFKIDNYLLTALYSLPSTFENFRCAIESQDELASPVVNRVKIIKESIVSKSKTRGAV